MLEDKKLEGWDDIANTPILSEIVSHSMRRDAEVN